MPNAATDPFGAMNAVAQQGAVAARPDIVVINDGQPVESVSKGSAGARYGKLAGLIIVPLAMGLMIGKMSAGANQYNQVIADAAPIRDNVKTIRRSLTEFQVALEEAKEGEKFKPGDKKLLAALEAIPTLEGDDELVW